MTQISCPSVLILGTGIAGLSAALKLAEKNFQVTLVCKADPAEGATRYAQGGIASVWSSLDSFEEHEKDTQIAGAALCHPRIVELCVKDGPTRVQELIDLGVRFTQIAQKSSAPSHSSKERFSLHREGGHQQRRILHADDLTGWAIEKALLDQVNRHPLIQILEDHIAIDLITEGKAIKREKNPGRCLGAYVLNIREKKILTLPAEKTVLATGGAGKVYLYTSNPDIATGDGIAIAHRAGARVANLEFIQFHPTCLFHPTARTFLVSEAVRGEGAVLKTLSGEDLMQRHHPMGSLAPRDIVARAIDLEMKRTGDKYVLLDCSKISPQTFRKKFPNIYETCLKYGLNPPEQPIPVVPAAHYICGGVLVDENGLTSVEGLYAVGEVACTGLHGANRLASNSLLEAVVFAHRVAEHMEKNQDPQTGSAKKLAPQFVGELPVWDAGQAVEIEEQIDIAASWLEIRTLMWNYVGIVRSNRRLERAKRRLALIKAEINSYYWAYLLTRDLIELRNLLHVAELIVSCAISRKESRGLHYTVDYPKRDDQNFSKDTIQ